MTEIKRIGRIICLYIFCLRVTWHLLCNREHEIWGSTDIGCASLRRQRESWAIKDRVGCGGHMSNQHHWDWQWPSLQTQRVWWLGPVIFCFVQSHLVSLPVIPAAMTTGEWGSWFLGVTSWNTLIPSQGAVHIYRLGDFRGALPMPPGPASQSHCCTHPSGHSATSALWNWPPRFGRALAHWSLRRETVMI